MIELKKYDTSPILKGFYLDIILQTKLLWAPAEEPKFNLQRMRSVIKKTIMLAMIINPIGK